MPKRRSQFLMCMMKVYARMEGWIGKSYKERGLRDKSMRPSPLLSAGFQL